MTIRETNYEIEGTTRVETILDEKNTAHEHKNNTEEKTEAIAMPEGQDVPKR